MSRPLIVVGLVMTMSACGIAIRPPAAQTERDLPGRVQQLVAQLGARDETKQIAAEWELLKLGPDILPLLPSVDPADKTPKARRLMTVHANLREVEPRLFTLSDKNASLQAALTALAEQTGMIVLDRRLDTMERAQPSCEKMPFWKALDALAVAGNARVAFHDGRLVLMTHREGSERSPTSYHGMFRTTIKRIAVNKDYDTDLSACLIHLEAAWEPRFQPFLFEVGPASVRFSKDKDGKAAEHRQPSRGRSAVAGRPAAEIELRVPAPPRSATRVESIQGTFTVIGPSKMLAFKFDKLKPFAPPAKPVAQVQDGVSVQLTEIATELDRWIVEVKIDNPPGGPVFESFQSWLGNNTIHFERGTGKNLQRLIPWGPDEEIIKQTATQAIVRYHFVPKNQTGAKLEKLADWTLVYRTPGRILELTIPYTFQDVALP